MGKRLIVKPYRYRGGDFRYNPDAAPNPAKFRGPRSASYRLYITGLDDSTSWQDVKDFARTGGRSVCYTDVYSKHGKKEGVIEYYRREDFEYALRYLDRARLNGCRVRVFDVCFVFMFLILALIQCNNMYIYIHTATTK